ncbi:hypothetical protein QDS01_18230 [Acinetobacter nosocomialis]|uniref:hypothetical protein n=1 Tax=Acinetobacter nosocomialis TaxID=106654 RepID=UPI00244CB3B1|nr:hypothetical protein [Acinetobacter nosocomialis]MDH2636851.1 hypothetical protein [Acinetobacter nosocomialis]
MTNHQRVLNLIELIGDEKVLEVCKDMQRRQISICEISKNCVDYRPKELHNPERAFMLQELLDGLNEYNRIQYEVDRELRNIFEPLVRETEYFKTHGHWSNFEFKRGEYINRTTQAMYEMFLKLYKKN